MRWILVFIMWPWAAWADVVPLIAAARGPLFAPAGGAERVQGASLFADKAGGGLFAPITRVPEQGFDDSAVALVRYVIGQAESPRAGYDAVQHGARVKPIKNPTQMTLEEIFAWIEATPGQPHAIGRYQFIPDTLRRVVAQTGARPSDKFGPAMQDRLADVLLDDAGFDAFLAGDLTQKAFMNNLAAIWAGLPTSSGRSKYHGVAGNRATITLAYFESEIAKIAPG